MPYTKGNAPDAVKALPAEAQGIWIAAYNSAFETYKGDEGKAAATAWSQVEKSGYKKGEDGKWVKMSEDDQKAAGQDKPKEKPEDKKPDEKTDKFADVRQMFKEWGPVLRRVALIGTDIPAVKTLKDVEARGKPGQLTDVEVFEAGWHTPMGAKKAEYFGIDFLDRVVRNFGALKGVLKPPLTLGHSPTQSILGASGFTDEDGQPAGGWVAELKRVGTKLVAHLVDDVPEAIREAIRRGAYKRISAEFDPTFAFTESAPTVWLFAEAEEGGGRDMEGTKVFTETEVKDRVKTEVEKETLKFREDLAKAQGDLKAAQKALDEFTARGRADKVKAFTEKLRTDGFPPALIEDIGLVKFMEGLDDSKALKFSEGKDAEEETALAFVMRFTEEIVKRAKSGQSLLVPKGREGATGKQKSFTQTKGEDETKADQAEIEEILGEDGKPKAKPDEK